MEFDLLHPDPTIENQKHKLKKLVQKPNSFFLDIKCKECGEVLATPTGGKLELKEGVHIRRKGE